MHGQQQQMRLGFELDERRAPDRAGHEIDRKLTFLDHQSGGVSILLFPGSPRQIDPLRGDGSGRMDDLHRGLAVDDKRGAQCLVASGYLRQAAIERQRVERSVDAERPGGVVGGVARLPLVQKPQSQLPEGQRWHAAAGPRPDRFGFVAVSLRLPLAFKQRAAGRRERVDFRLEIAHVTRLPDEAHGDRRGR